MIPRGSTTARADRQEAAWKKALESSINDMESQKSHRQINKQPHIKLYEESISHEVSYLG